jgi:hypothetical protein
MAEVPISRPSPPRPEDYVVVPGSQGPRRDFRNSVGLREGWDAEGRVFDLSEAVPHGSRLDEAPCRVRPARTFRHVYSRGSHLCLATRRRHGRFGPRTRSPIHGRSGPRVPGHLSDAAIEAMLNELATELGAALGQERIYVAFETGHGFWMPASIAGDTWPGVRVTRGPVCWRPPYAVSERRVFVSRAAGTWTP